MISVLLGLGWGVLAASPIVARAHRLGAGARVTRLAEGAGARVARPPTATRIRAHLPEPPRALRHVVAGAIDRIRRRRTDLEIARDLPVTIDLLTIAVVSGCTPFLAVEVAARWAPPALGRRLHDVCRSVALGRSLSEALAEMVVEVPALAGVADALLVSDRLGAPVADALGRLAVELRADLRRRAEARARTIPVRLLFPLVFLVLPAFGLLTIVPAVVAGLSG